jgi:uncharacterized iron-regulated membrane protein
MSISRPIVSDRAPSPRQSEMTAWQRWVRFPQNLWIRKAFFQIHLWMGIGIGLYVLLISVSGALIVYRPQLSKRFNRPEIVLDASRPRMTPDELEAAAQHVYPGYLVANIFQSRRPDRPIAIALERGDERIVRLFDPYAGRDLGDPLSAGQRVVEWLVDLHDNLLLGQTGRLVNGIAAIFVTILSLAGAFIWWPGIKNWRRSLTIDWKANFPRFNWDLHNALGFWFFLFVLMWGISGIYFSFPRYFDVLGNQTTSWLAKLHFGRIGWFTRALWTILGLVPAILFVTGVLMWWERVLRKRFRRPYETGK